VDVGLVPLHEGEILRRGDLEIPLLARHDHDGAAGGLHEGGVVGGIRGPFVRPTQDRRTEGLGCLNTNDRRAIQCRSDDTVVHQLHRVRHRQARDRSVRASGDGVHDGTEESH